MKKLISIFSVLFQFISTLIVLFIIYIILAFLDNLNNNDPDFPNAIGFVIIQPVFGIIFVFLTIFICTIVGLPIRLMPKLFNWWNNRPMIILAGVVSGLLLIVMSLIPYFAETAKIVVDGEEKVKQIPNTNLGITGWFLTAFSLLHFYPLSLIKWIIKKLRIYEALWKLFTLFHEQTLKLGLSPPFLVVKMKQSGFSFPKDGLPAELQCLFPEWGDLYGSLHLYPPVHSILNSFDLDRVGEGRFNFSTSYIFVS